MSSICENKLIAKGNYAHVVLMIDSLLKQEALEKDGTSTIDSRMDLEEASLEYAKGVLKNAGIN